MNMLIALMSSVFEKVESNAKAADSRRLASMILECEEIYKAFTTLARRPIANEFKYYLYTRKTKTN